MSVVKRKIRSEKC